MVFWAHMQEVLREKMSRTFGIDTSNYTTSCAVFDSKTGEVFQSKKLLPVKSGELGLRQSDAVFHHTKQFSEVVDKIKDKCENICAVGVSTKPRWIEGSYMPCFLVGESIASGICAVSNLELFKTSHQIGHILSALYSCGKLSLLKEKKPFIAFHISGGTTDMLLCQGDEDEVIKIEEIGTSLDLKAGQLVDRAGVMMGLAFPCGKEIESLANNSQKDFKIRPTIKGMNCCLSGGENIFKKMYENGDSKEDISRFALEYVYSAIKGMILSAYEKYGRLELVFAGGVMSDKIIADKLSKEFGGNFAKAEFSCDNATGVAIFSAIKKGLI